MGKIQRTSKQGYAALTKSQQHIYQRCAEKGSLADSRSCEKGCSVGEAGFLRDWSGDGRDGD